MSEGGHRPKPGIAPDAGRPQPAADPAYVPQAGGDRDRSWPLTDPMRHVRHEQQQAAAQIQRSLKAWRKVADQKSGGSATSIPQQPGASLGSDVRGKMEGQIGADLTQAKIHTSGESAKAAEGMGARAFTVGNDVHFGSGEFAPGTKEGDRLLAHELTHVAQGQKSGVQRKADADADHAANGAEVSQPGEPAEKEADAVADHVADKLHGKQVSGSAKADAKTENGSAVEAPAEAAPPVAAKLILGMVARKKKDDPATPDKSAKHSAANSLGKGDGDRVKQPVPGLYDSINGGLAEKKPLTVGNLVFKDQIIRKYADGTPRQIATSVKMPGNEKAFGEVTRSLEVAKDGSKTLVMDMAFLDAIPKEQSWVTEDGKALKPGRGIPLQTYLSIRQMKLFGVEYGDLGKPNFQKVKLSTIVNERTIWGLAESTKKEPGAPEAERLKRTHSVQYADTVITQAGAKIVDAHLEDGVVTTAHEYATQKSTPDEPKKRGLAPNDPVRKNFNINLKVAPFGPKSSVPSEIKAGDS
jgi:hypothetical protein